MNLQTFRCFKNAVLHVAGVVIVSALADPASAQDDHSPSGGLPQDWSHKYVVYSHPDTRDQAVQKGTLREWNEKAKDPRFVLQLEKVQERADRGHLDRLAAKKKPRPRHPPPQSGGVDWSVSLGSGATNNPAVFPAKYSFTVDSNPDCTNDFVVFPINAAGSATQPTIAAFNNLYTEPTGNAGSCGTGVTGPSVLWAYNTTRRVRTSPVLSLDGKSVAFVDGNASSGTLARVTLHVLRWKAGEGSIGSPISMTAGPISACPPGSATSCMLDLDLPIATGVSLGGSLFVDYDNDVGYVTDNNGRLYKVKDVFCATPTCQMTPVDPTNVWTVNTGAAGKLFSPVYDFNAHIFVTSLNGDLYMVTDNGSTGTLSGTVVAFGGNGSTVDGPIIALADSPSNHKVFAFANTGSTGHETKAVVVQSPVPISATVVTADLGINSPNDIYSGAFDNNYFGGTPSSGYLYVCSANTTTRAPSLYRIGFAGYPAMNGSIDAGPLVMSNSTSAVCAPLTEIYNTSTGHDWLFASITSQCQNGGAFVASNILTGPLNAACLRAFEITNAFPIPGTSPNDSSTGPRPGSVPTVQPAGPGTSGIIIDNVSTAAQASSLYFTTANFAVKLTQAGLQ